MREQGGQKGLNIEYPRRFVADVRGRSKAESASDPSKGQAWGQSAGQTWGQSAGQAWGQSAHRCRIGLDLIGAKI